MMHTMLNDVHEMSMQDIARLLYSYGRWRKDLFEAVYSRLHNFSDLSRDDEPSRQKF